jgi:pimeloyl-ACP methyl ester carboxylesterase
VSVSRLMPPTVLFVLHGIGRNCAAYRRDWASFCKAHDIVLCVPHFPEHEFPKHEGYILNPLAYKQFDDVVKSTLAACDPKKRAKIVLFGHSAGAQFAERAVLFCPSIPLSRTTVYLCNAGWYVLPERSSQYPYGLGGLPANMEKRVSKVAAWHVVLGSKDTKRVLVRFTEEANRQGGNRVERGRLFFRMLRDLHTNVHLHLVDNCGHQHKCIASYVQQNSIGGIYWS